MMDSGVVSFRAEDVQSVVVDTNIVLDMLVFQDPATQPLIQALVAQQLRWIATPAMREELVRVLAYPQVVKRLQATQPAASGALEVLARFDAQVQRVDVAPKAPVTCKDPDDQKFIDLAVLHKARLLSKDKAVLCMKKRLLALGVLAGTAL